MMVENDHYEISQDDLAQACRLFDTFWSAQTQKAVLGSFRQLCEKLRLRPTNFPQFFPRLKSKLKSWKAQSLWTKIEKRASHRCYAKGKACLNTRVLIIGGGPCGLRTAIEAQLCGAKVVVIEKRDRFSRNNVLHLWPYVIHDLKALGAKKFYGKFCAGSIDHISIRQLQCILLKISLLVGIEVHENVTFVELLEPPVDQTSERIGWRASVIPSDHPVSQYEFDVLVGADGKRNTLQGFSRKEFRGKLAIAITANFINRHSEAEARVEEISGVAFIFNQKFFKDLDAATGIDLENIVYYKDETHYFVMTAKKHSLISKGVILRDYPDTAMLLAPENVDRVALLDYAREAADFSTNYQMPSLDFAVNHYGQPDVAMFDFTSMYAAENACRVVEKRGHKLLLALVGDSLLEPFWPTGSGCARGFLGAFDAAWMMISWSDENKTVLQTIAEREGIYRLLAQTTPENLSKDFNSYSLDPGSRYPNFVRSVVLPFQVRHLYVTDNPEAVNAAVPVVVEAPRKKRRRDSVVHPNALLEWLKKQVEPYSDIVSVSDMCHSFKNGMALCCIIHRYRPNLLDVRALNAEHVERNNQLAFDLLEAEMGISPVMTGSEMATCEIPDKLTMISYLSQVYECFRREIPHVPRKPELDSAGSLDSIPETTRRTATPGQRLSLLNKISRMSTQHSSALSSGSTRSKAHEAREQAVAELLSPPSTIHSNSGSLARRSRKRRAAPKELASKLGTASLPRSKPRHASLGHHSTYERQRFERSMQLLQGCAKDVREVRVAGEEDLPEMEDYTLVLYRKTACNFGDRVRDLESKLFYPGREDRKARINAHSRSANDEVAILDRKVRNLEAKLMSPTRGKSTQKPKDMVRAIGKLDADDWNVKKIQAKIDDQKKAPMLCSGEEDRRVPKWSKDIFKEKLDNAKKIEAGESSEESSQSKPASSSLAKPVHFDSQLKLLEKKLREGSTMEVGQRGANKVSAMAEQLASKLDHRNGKDGKPLQRSNSKSGLVFSLPKSDSEKCHFCQKRVYLMERHSTEGRFFHRGCFRCEYCGTVLRIGNYGFERDDNGGPGKFMCMQHYLYGTSGVTSGLRRNWKRKAEEIDALAKENFPPEVFVRKSEKADEILGGKVQPLPATSPVGVTEGERIPVGLSLGTPAAETVVALASSTPDARTTPVVVANAAAEKLARSSEARRLHRVTTPERIEFENSVFVLESPAHHGGQSEDEVLSEMDEDEWTDRNFGQVTATEDEDMIIDDSDSEMSDENEPNAADKIAIEESLEEPLSADRTRKLAESWQRRHSEAEVLEEEEEEEEEEDDDDDEEDDEDDDEDDEEEEDTDADEDVARDAKPEQVHFQEAPIAAAMKPVVESAVVQAVPAAIDEDEETATADDFGGNMSEEDIPIRQSAESLVSSSLSSSSTSSSGSSSDSSDDEGTSTDIETDSELERNTELKKFPSHRRREASKEPIIRVHCRINGEPNSIRALESSKSCDIGKLMAQSEARRRQKQHKISEKREHQVRPSSPEHKPLAPLPLESLAPRHSASTTQLPSLMKLPVYESSRLADPRRYARSTFRLLSNDADPMVASTSSIPTSSSLLSSKTIGNETKKLDQPGKHTFEVSAHAKDIIGNIAAENRRNRTGNASGGADKFSDFFASISQNQKLLQPAPNPSAEIKAFLEGGNKQFAGRTPPPSPRFGVQPPVIEPGVEAKIEQQNGNHEPLPPQPAERRGSLSTNESPTVSVEEEVAAGKDEEEIPEDMEVDEDDVLNQAMNESDLAKGVTATEDDSIFEAINDIDTLNVTSIDGVDEEFDKIVAEEQENLDVAIQNFTMIVQGGAELEMESNDFDDVCSPVPVEESVKAEEFAMVEEPRPEPEGDLAARFCDEFDSLEYMDANASLASATPSFKRPLQVFNPPDLVKDLKKAEIKEATPPKAAVEEVDDLEVEMEQQVVNVVEAVNEAVVEAASSPETEGPDSHLSMDSEELAALRREAVERDVTPGTTPSSPEKLLEIAPEVTKPLTVDVSEAPPVPKSQPPNEDDDVELDNSTNWFSKQSPFGCIRDSIHVRKSNLKKSPPKDKSPSPQPFNAKSPSPQPLAMKPPMARLPSLPSLRSPPPLSPPARPPPPVVWETREQEAMRRVSEDREKQKNLVREMVLSKIKSPENRKERKFVRSSPSFVSQESLASSGTGSAASGPVATPAVGNGLKSGASESNLSPRKISAPSPQTSAGALISPDEFYTPMTSFRPALRRPVSMAIPASGATMGTTPEETPTTTAAAVVLPDTPLTKPDRYTLNTIGKTLFSSPDLTKAVAATPERVNWDDLRVLRTAERERARQSVRDQIRVKSDAELGLSPPNTIDTLKDRLRRRNGPPSAAPEDSKLQQVKDFQEDRKSKLEMLEKMAVFTPSPTGATARSCPTSPEKSAVRRVADVSPSSSRISSPDACSSAPVSVAPAMTPPPGVATAPSTEKKKKSKDPERRRSIIQLVHGLFSRSSADKEKEKQKNANKDALSGATSPTSELEAKAASPPLRSPKLKERASPFRLKNKEKQKEKKGKKKSTGPSPATTATPTSPSRLDDSFKAMSLTDKSTLETPPAALGTDELDDDDPLALLSGSGTLTRRQEKLAKRASRQAELKRLRMAQEIQRQLEELEVKQKELEERGVAVEKALRGEGSAADNSKEETELMGEWFALVHEKTRLGRYEQELLVRAKELELEDRQARLQQNLRERLAVDDEMKTKEDIDAEREILNEMVEIVEQRDTLLEMMEEDRLRYREEDKDLEAAMLAKGLQLTPIRKETGV